MKNYKNLLMKAKTLIQKKRNQMLIDAVEANKPNKVKFAILLGADVADDDNFAIRLASFFGYAQVVKLLIKAGANVSANDNEAIFLATENDHIEVVKLLIEANTKL